MITIPPVILYHTMTEYGKKKEEKDANISGTIYIGVNDGPYNTILSSTESSTLAQNTPVILQILTPSICLFDGNVTEYNTSCNGAVTLDVNYSKDGECKVKFSDIEYEY